MKAYRSGRRNSNSWVKNGVIASIALVAIAIAGFFAISRYYESSLQPVDPGSTKAILFTVRSGMTSAQIAQGLKDKDLIRNTRSFVQYVRTNELAEKFIAGTYELNKAMSTPDVVDKLIGGSVATDLFTIYPGANMDQIRKSFLGTGQYSDAEIDRAFDPSLYDGHPALVDLPAGSSLEGFLYPDSYHFIAETRPEDIVRQALDEMAIALKPEVRAGISGQGLSVYQGVILASIVEREVGEYGPDGQPNDNRAKAAQVFIKRLQSNIKLESNATDGYPAEYDTYSIDGLPPEPISNTSASSLKAVADPSNTNYLFFVSGSDCITRFSETNEQHEILKSTHGIARPEDNCQG